MENANKLLMLGFSVILFAAAVAVTIVMYYHNYSFMNEIEGYDSFGVIEKER